MNEPDSRRYQVKEALGRGGFGTVYRAELTSTGGFTKPVALKVLNPQVQSDEDVVRRLRDEARMLGLLNHRAIVKVDGLVRLSGRWAVVMEYVHGASLDQVVRSQGAVPTRVALQIAVEVASALDAAYARAAVGGKALGLIHRDVKPANIQLTSGGDVKLLDFGVARAGFDGREAQTRSVTFGSVQYMAPERFELEDHHVSDVYALAATLYELLVGEALGQASPNPIRHAERLKQGKERMEQAGVPPDVIDFVLEGLEYEAERRMDARRFEQTAERLASSAPGPRLKDWAEVSIEWVLRSRQTQADELTGQVLSEAMSTERPPPPPPTLPPKPPPPPPLSSTPTAPRRAPARPPPRPSQAGRVLRVVGWSLLLALMVSIAGGMLSFVGCCGGCGTLISVMEADDKQIDEIKAKVAGKVPNEPLRPQLDALLDRGYGDLSSGKLSLWEYSSFGVEVESSIEDGILTQYELDQLKIQYQDMMSD